MRRAIAQDGADIEEKDTKTYQRRHVTVDPGTVTALRDRDLLDRGAGLVDDTGGVLGLRPVHPAVSDRTADGGVVAGCGRFLSVHHRWFPVVGSRRSGQARLPVGH